MKLKSILTASILGLALGSMANADTIGTVVRFTGSTAYRGQTHNAILHCFDAAPKAGVSSDSTDSVFNGTISGHATTIICHWSGSEQAILSLANQSDTGNQITFLNPNIINDSSTKYGTLVGGTTIPTLTSTDVSNYLNDKEFPDAGMADTFQSSSLYKTNNTRGFNTLKGYYADGIVGVVMFKWLASPNAPISNITEQQVKALYTTGGFLDLAQFTGANGTMGVNYVYGIGRDSMSGTRLTAFAETTVGATQAVSQWEPRSSSDTQISAYTGTAIDHLALLTDGPTGGYSSGGNLCKAIANPAPTNTILVGYAGTGDTDNKTGQGISAGAVELAYNGVTLGTDGNNWQKVANGTYTFWGYEHLYYTPAIASATSGSGDIYYKKVAANTIAKQIREGNASTQHITSPDGMHPWISTSDATKNEMQCQRTTDGANVNLLDTVPFNPPYLPQ
jgi:hypothetical protein